MAKLPIILILAAIVITTYALQCYQCTGSKCDDVGKAPEVKCDSNPNLEYRCIKKVEKDKVTSALNVTRGCYILRNDNDKTYCNIADPSKTESVFCDACKEDLCNSAINFRVDVGALTAVTLGVLAAKLYAY